MFFLYMLFLLMNVSLGAMDSTFSTIELKLSTERTVDTAQAPFVNNRFFDESTKKNHPHCPTCEKRFSSICSFNKHIQKFHEEPKKQMLRCSVPGCTQKFFALPFYQKHVIRCQKSFQKAQETQQGILKRVLEQKEFIEQEHLLKQAKFEQSAQFMLPKLTSEPLLVSKLSCEQTLG